MNRSLGIASKLGWCLTIRFTMMSDDACTILLGAWADKGAAADGVGS